MKNILLFIQKNVSLDFAVYEKTVYGTLWDTFRIKNGNAGNKVWLTAVEQYLSQEDIHYDYLSDDMTPDKINETYDMIVYPCANLLRNDKKALDNVARATAFFKNIRIPIYVLGLGVQAPSYDHKGMLVRSLRSTSTPFLRTVYQTGGSIGVRGYFTHEVLSEWGFKESVVLGCPSLYSKGRDLQITKNNARTFAPVLNLRMEDFSYRIIKREIENNPNCECVDQNAFIRLLYDPVYQSSIVHMTPRAFRSLIDRYTREGLLLAAESRLHLFYDAPVWQAYLRDRMFNFSYGSRIHGNFIAVLQGIPAVVSICDSRTRELAEYFELPICQHPETQDSLYEVYQNADYTRFNRSFSERFDQFAAFMRGNGIVDDISNHHVHDQKVAAVGFKQPPDIPSEVQEALQRLLKEAKPLITGGCVRRLKRIASNLYRRLRL